MIERSDGSFQLSATAHNHPADPGAAVSAAITATVKAKAAADIFRPASAIVEEVLLDQMTDGPYSSIQTFSLGSRIWVTEFIQP